MRLHRLIVVFMAAVVLGIFSAGCYHVSAGEDAPRKDTAKMDDAEKGSWPMPVGQVRTIKQIEADYFIARSVPFEDPALSFSILLPKGWYGLNLEAPAKASSRILIPLGTFVPKNEKHKGAQVKFSYIVLARDVNTQDWVKAHAEKKKMTVVKSKQVKYAKRVASELIVTWKEGTSKLVSRLSARQFGRWLVLLTCTAPEALYRTQADNFSLACATFSLKNPPRQRLAEKLSQRVVDVKGAKLVFRWPASWRMVDAAAPEGNICWSLRFEVQDSDLGFIRVNVLDRSKFPDVDEAGLLEMTLDQITSSGIEVGKTEEKFEIDLPNMQSKAKVTTCKSLYKKKIENELNIIMISSPDALCAVFGFRPTRERNIQAWMIGKRALEILLGWSQVVKMQDLTPEKSGEAGK